MDMPLKSSVSFIFLLLMSSLLITPVLAQEAAVYRWVDENGNVHFSDMPRNKNAKLFFVRQNNASEPAVSAEEVEQNNEALANVNADGNDDVVRQNPVYQIPTEQTLTEQECTEIKAQMRMC